MTTGAVTTDYLTERTSGMTQVVDDGTNAYLHDVTGNSVSTNNSDDATYPLADALLSTRVTLDDSGTPIGSTGIHGYTGERKDPTSGLVYLRARDYSPGTTRFAQPDPVQPNAGGTHSYNPYWYANNNPGLLIGGAED